MQRREKKSLTTAAYGLFAAFTILFLAAGPAAAQVPDPGDLVEDATGNVDDAATQAGNGVAGAVEDVTGDVGGTIGGPVGDTIEDLGSTAGDAIEESTSQAGDLAGDTGSAVDDIVDGVIGGATQPDPSGEPGVGKGKSHGRFQDGRSVRGTRNEDVPETTVELAPSGSLLTDPSDDVQSTVSQGAGPERSILGSLGGIAFPLALIGIVAAFLAIQGKVDRSDPKLSIAILDPEDEALIFR